MTAMDAHYLPIVLKLYSEDLGKVRPFPPVQPIKARLGGARMPGS